MRILACLFVILTACGFPRPARLADDAGTGDAGTDAPVCTGDLTTADNCGACGHSCGGGVCDRGVCDAVALPNLTAASSFWVDGKTLYFTNAHRVLACPSSGCVNQPTQLFDPGPNGYDAASVSASNGTLYFMSAPVQATERDAVYNCALTGCVAPLTAVAAGGFGVDYIDNFAGDVYYSISGRDLVRRSCAADFGACTAAVTVHDSVSPTSRQLAASTDQVFFVDANGVEKCPYAGCGSPSTSTSLTTSVPTGIAYFNGLVYMQFGTDNTLFSGAIRTCTPGDCDTNKPKDIIARRNTIFAFTVDNNGVYWIEEGQSQSGPSTLFMCAAPSCVGGAKTLFTGVTASAANLTGRMHELVTDDAFIYWLNDDAGTVMRIAKPL
jgi:hypothetical protein